MSKALTPALTVSTRIGFCAAHAVDLAFLISVLPKASRALLCIFGYFMFMAGYDCFAVHLVRSYEPAVAWEAEWHVRRVLP